MSMLLSISAPAPAPAATPAMPASGIFPLSILPVAAYAVPSRTSAVSASNPHAVLPEVLPGIRDALRAAKTSLSSAPGRTGGDVQVRHRLQSLVSETGKAIAGITASALHGDATSRAAAKKNIVSALQSVTEMQPLIRHLQLSETGSEPVRVGIANHADKGAVVNVDGNAGSARRAALGPLLQDARHLSAAELGSRAALLAASGDHQQAALFSVAADMKQTALDSNPIYMLQTCKSLLAMGHAADAMQGLQLASAQLARNPALTNGTILHGEIAELMSQAKLAVNTGDPKNNRVIHPMLSKKNETDLSCRAEKAQQLMTVWIEKNACDFDSAMTELAKIQHETAGTRAESQKADIKFNRDQRNNQITETLKAIDDRIKAEADRKAASKKTGWWASISQYFGLAVAALGILLAPLTGGLSLLAAAYMVVDFALELGEKISGIKMSIQSGIQIACEKIVDLVAQGGGTEDSRKAIAGWIALAVGLIINIAAIVLTCGVGAIKQIPKLMKQIPKLMKGGKALLRLARRVPSALKNAAPTLKNEVGAAKAVAKTATKTGAKTATKSAKMAAKTATKETTKKSAKAVTKAAKTVEINPLRRFPAIKKIGHTAMVMGQLAGGGAAVGGGLYAIDTANARLDVNHSDETRSKIEIRQTRLDKFFQQCNDDLKILAREQQRDIALISDMLWANIENRAKNMEALFRHTRQPV